MLKNIRRVISVLLWVVCGYVVVKAGVAGWLMYASVSVSDSFGGLSSVLMLGVSGVLLIVGVVVGLLASVVWTDEE